MGNPRVNQAIQTINWVKLDQGSSLVWRNSLHFKIVCLTIKDERHSCFIHVMKARLSQFSNSPKVATSVLNFKIPLPCLEPSKVSSSYLLAPTSQAEYDEQVEVINLVTHSK